MKGQGQAKKRQRSELMELRQRTADLEMFETGRKEAEGRLKTSELRFRRLFETAQDGILILDAETGTIEVVNPFLVEMLGYSHEEVLGKKLWEIGFFKDIAASRSAFKELQEKEYIRYEDLPLETKKGRCMEVEFVSNVYRVDGKKVIQCNVRDLTGRKVSTALRESEEKYLQVVENSAEAILVVQDGVIKFLNHNTVELMGYSKEELMLRPFVDFIHPEDREMVLERHLRRIREEAIPRVYSFRVVDKDGDTKWVEINVALISWESKLATLNFLTNITDRKQAETSLQESKERYRELFDGAPVGYFEFDIEGRITSVNRTELEMLGYTAEEMIGQPVWNFNVEGALARGQILGKLTGTLPPARNLEGNYRKKDGTALPVLIEDRLLRDAEGRIVGIRSTIQDITDRKQAEKENLEEQFRQSQKMEAIGSFAGGIAHDFNNLLTIIKGFNQLSFIELKEDDPLRGNLDEVRKATDRAADLIRQLLTFSRHQVLEVQSLDLNNAFRNLEKMLRRVIGEDVELVTVLAEDLGRVKTNPGQVEQVIMNLAVNARDAMPSGGKLIIETANVELDEAYIRKHVAVTPGHYVMLAVSDTGVGMTKEVKDRVFEPFFTTKEKGRGTGLGLSTVYGIVKQSGGNIWIYSELGRGTTFKIYFPRVNDPLEEVEEKVMRQALPRGRETILVVEDEEVVRRLAVEILMGQGYRVLEASNGVDTLNICKGQTGPIDLILTDVVMPQMGGRQLVEQLRRQYRDLKVLYMSGYTDKFIDDRGVLDVGVNYIQKPFAIEGLAKKVREVLDK
jgi:two-component system, cell cycle sensor histidine kinase and response regulator CckA